MGKQALILWRGLGDEELLTQAWLNNNLQAIRFPLHNPQIVRYGNMQRLKTRHT